MHHREFCRLIARTAIGLIATTYLLVMPAGAEEIVEPIPAPAYEPLDDAVVAPEVAAPQDTPPVPADMGWESAASLSLEGGESMAMMSAPSSVAAGRTPGTFAVTQSGAATYTIPLWTPPGVGEVQLKLALVYNSRGGNGVLGQGWSLQGLSAITRCNRTWAQDGVASGVLNTLDDRYCLDGQQLKWVSGSPPGQGGAVYATEIETFSRIVANGPQIGNGPTSFTVTTKNGLVYEYGTTTDSRIFAGTTGTVRTWALSRIRDRASITAGNRIDLAYTNDAQNGNYTHGSYRIATISYPTTATGQGPFYRVSFGYAVRPTSDIPSGYLAGFVVREPNELSTITIENLVTSSTIKAYYLGYDSGTASSRRRLRTVQECSAASCFPATTIGYQNGQAGWPNSPSATTIAITDPLRTRLLDANGDGRDDLLYTTSPTSATRRWWLALSSGSGYSAPIDTGITINYGEHATVSDVDMDGRADLVLPIGGMWHQVSYNGAGFTQTSLGLSTTSVPRPEFADINGDGRPDVVFPTNAVAIRFNTTTVGQPTSFSSTTTVAWTPPPPWGVQYMVVPSTATRIRAVDFNGDGKSDLAVTVGYYTGYPLNLTTSNVYLVSNGATMTPANGTASPDGPSGTLVDWNGDGCTDVFDRIGSYPNSSHRVRLSNCGDGLEPAIDLDLSGGARACLWTGMETAAQTCYRTTTMFGGCLDRRGVELRCPSRRVFKHRSRLNGSHTIVTATD